MKNLPRYRKCFVCGADNACGLQSHCQTDGQRVFLTSPPREHHVRYRNRVHGGIMSAALDEVMGWAVYVATRQMFYTLEITVRFIKPLTPGTPVRAIGEFAGSEKLYHNARARLVGEDGTIYARSTGKYVQIPPDEAKEVLGYLDGETEGLFDL